MQVLGILRVLGMVITLLPTYDRDLDTTFGLSRLLGLTDKLRLSYKIMAHVRRFPRNVISRPLTDPGSPNSDTFSPSLGLNLGLRWYRQAKLSIPGMCFDR